MLWCPTLTTPVPAACGRRAKPADRASGSAASPALSPAGNPALSRCPFSPSPARAPPATAFACTTPASASPPTPSWCGPRCRLGNVNSREEDCLEFLTGAHDCSLDHGSATGSIDEGLSCPTRRPPAHALDAHDAAAATGVNPKTGCTPLEDSLNHLAAEKSDARARAPAPTGPLTHRAAARIRPLTFPSSHTRRPNFPAAARLCSVRSWWCRPSRDC